MDTGEETGRDKWRRKEIKGIKRKRDEIIREEIKEEMKRDERRGKKRR